MLAGSLELGLSASLEAVCTSSAIPSAIQELCHGLRTLMAVAALTAQRVPQAAQAAERPANSHARPPGERIGSSQDSSTDPGNDHPDSHSGQAGLDEAAQGEEATAGAGSIVQQGCAAVQRFALCILAGARTGASPSQLLAALALQRSGLQLLADAGLALPGEALQSITDPTSPLAGLRRAPVPLACQVKADTLALCAPCKVHGMTQGCQSCMPGAVDREPSLIVQRPQRRCSRQGCGRDLHPPAAGPAAAHQRGSIQRPAVGAARQPLLSSWRSRHVQRSPASDAKHS